jgi:N-methylhydantoinase A
VITQFGSAGIDAADVQIERYLFMKYGLQVHKIAVALRATPVRPQDQEVISADFEAEYERFFGRGAGYRRAGMEIVKCSVVGACSVSNLRIGEQAPLGGTDWSAALKTERTAVFDARSGAVPVQTLDGENLRSGNVLRGPVIIERPGDTVVVPPGMEAYVDRFQNIRIDLG